MGMCGVGRGGEGARTGPRSPAAMTSCRAGKQTHTSPQSTPRSRRGLCRWAGPPPTQCELAEPGSLAGGACSKPTCSRSRQRANCPSTCPRGRLGALGQEEVATVFQLLKRTLVLTHRAQGVSSYLAEAGEQRPHSSDCLGHLSRQSGLGASPVTAGQPTLQGCDCPDFFFPPLAPRRSRSTSGPLPGLHLSSTC